MARLPFPTVLALSLPLVAACTPPEPPRCPQASPAATTPARRPTPAPAPASGEADAEGSATFHLSITIKPIAESATVEVDISARGPASDLDEWTISAPLQDAVRDIEARDTDGTVPVTTSLAPADEKPGAASSSAPSALRIRLTRPPLGPLR